MLRNVPAKRAIAALAATLIPPGASVHGESSMLMFRKDLFEETGWATVPPGTRKSTQIAGALAGKMTVDAALKASQAAANKAAKQAGYKSIFGIRPEHLSEQVNDPEHVPVTATIRDI
jgi:hypothetical protein